MIYRQPGSIKSKRTSFKIQPQKPQATILMINLQGQPQQINLSSMNLFEIPSELSNHYISKLTLDYNNINKAVISQKIPLTLQLSLVGNAMTEFFVEKKTLTNNNEANLLNKHQINNITKLQYPIQTNKLKNLIKINLSQNQLSSLNLEELSNLQYLDCRNNYLKTLLLPINSRLQQINLSNNQITNITYSLCRNGPQRNLQYLYMNQNNLHELTFESHYLSSSQIKNSQNNIQNNSTIMFPKLKILSCNHNFISFIQKIPFSLQQIHLQDNQLTLDRTSVRNLIYSSNLKTLNLKGNSISREIYSIFKEKMPHCFIISEQISEQQNQSFGTIYRESPYRLYYDNTYGPQKAQQLNQKYIQKSVLNFTLGQCPQSQIQYQQCSYDVLLDKSIENKQDTSKQSHKQQEQVKHIEEDNKENIANEKNTTTPIKYQNYCDQKIIQKKEHALSLKINCEYHPIKYEQLLRKIVKYSIIPPYLISHQQKSQFISRRIDQPPRNEENQFTFFKQIFSENRKIQYVRKVFNASLTQLVNSKKALNLYEIRFIDKQWTKDQFLQLYQHDFRSITNLGQSMVRLSEKPKSFTPYHVLVRQKKQSKKYLNISAKYGCFYLIQSSQF